MPTMDEILDGKTRVRGVMSVPAALLDQWLLHPGELWKMFHLFEQKLNDAGFRYDLITTAFLHGRLPQIMQNAWLEACSTGWVSGDIPPFHFEQDSLDLSRVGLVWEGEMVTVNFEQVG